MQFSQASGLSYNLIQGILHLFSIFVQFSLILPADLAIHFETHGRFLKFDSLLHDHRLLTRNNFIIHLVVKTGHFLQGGSLLAVLICCAHQIFDGALNLSFIAEFAHLAVLADHQKETFGKMNLHFTII